MKKHLAIHLAGLVLIAMLSGCACWTGPATPVPSPRDQVIAQPLAGEAALRTELYFGLSIAAAPDHPAGEVSEAQWRDFVDTWVTPRFPSGLTVLDGYGQWLGKDGALAKEHSKVLVLLHPAPTPEEWARVDQGIEEIRTAYCRLFRQESVLRVTSRVGVAF